MYGGAIQQNRGVEEGPGFRELGLSEQSLRVLERLGFEFPTEIQRRVIPLALEGRDVIGLAETGSGKTAAFSLPLIERLRREGRAVILSPTREIALQTMAFLQNFTGRPSRAAAAEPGRPGAAGADSPPSGRGSARRGRRRRRTRQELRAGLAAAQVGGEPGPRDADADLDEAALGLDVEEPTPDRQLDAACLIGGVRIGGQFDQLERTPSLVVATPGRLLDHSERGTIDLSQFDELVLDEADHMLDLGFLPQIQRVMQRLPERRRTLFFSATMPQQIENLVRRFLVDPVTVDLRPDNSAAAGLEHRLYLVDEENKKPCILSLLEHVEGSTLVFTRRKSDAEWLCKVLEAGGHPVERIHSDRSQTHRVRALKSFREGENRILVATDVAARGIDIPTIAHVVNFDLPETVEDYVHRAGRTARGAASGVVSSIGTWMDKAIVRSIERTLGAPLERCEAPGVAAYEERQKRLAARRRSPLRR
ncbi:MAG: ATP-dependent helicase [Acidobacteria bacterium]|nr:MAG: ATP-dependent helicase [Acidobacteriota bacterium]REK05884.1 MAG: ATP-dependent helicase [Acidobacteriota bacterium]